MISILEQVSSLAIHQVIDPLAPINIPFLKVANPDPRPPVGLNISYVEGPILQILFVLRLFAQLAKYVLFDFV